MCDALHEEFVVDSYASVAGVALRFGHKLFFIADFLTSSVTVTDALWRPAQVESVYSMVHETSCPILVVRVRLPGWIFS